MCGFDSLATALLRGHGLVRASCLHCGQRMEVRIEGAKVASASPPSTVFWLGEAPKASEFAIM